MLLTLSKRMSLGLAFALLAAVLLPLLSYADAPKLSVKEPSRDSTDKFTPPPPQSRLITQSQYSRVIKDVFGPDITIAVRFPPLPREGGLETLATTDTALTPAGFESFYSAASDVAAKVVDEEHREFLIPCKPRSISAPDDKCAERFFQSVGPVLYRRPLTKEEAAFQVWAAAQGTVAAKNFYRGLALSLTGMLVSPKFLMISDTITTDRQRPLAAKLDAYSKASRLSLFLWNSFPDRALLNAAKDGRLDVKAGIEYQVQRMMKSPRMEAGVRAFFEDMLRLDGIEGVSKDPTVYPMYTRRVAAAAKEQVLRTVVDLVLVQDTDYRNLFTTKTLFVSPVLGPIYNMPVTDPAEWSEITDTSAERAGLLTQPAFLAEYAHTARSSPTRRGRAVREIFLCQNVPNPPSNVDFSALNDPDPKLKTVRDRLSAHRSNPVCAGCHRITDPIGLALENFDGAGRYRETEDGAAIDASGNLDGTKFQNITEFTEAVAHSPQLPRCLTTRLADFAVARNLGTPQKPWIDRLQQDFVANGYRVLKLIEDIATSDEFYSISSPVVDKSAVANTSVALLN
jgi:Protein of unknown function (DUF1592)/Protein of unknown function (DUF1588)/Protein of unknown function (DUF1585)/Protein of unknown function (DUF1595)/Protein of unknown function (DUF1587)